MAFIGLENTSTVGVFVDESPSAVHVAWEQATESEPYLPLKMNGQQTYVHHDNIVYIEPDADEQEEAT